MPKIVFRNLGRSVDVERGTSVLEAALANGIPMYHTCGGNCSCSTCRIVVVKGAANITPMEAGEAEVLDTFDLKPPHRLGCQSLVTGDVEVDIPERDKAPRPNKTPPLPD